MVRKGAVLVVEFGALVWRHLANFRRQELLLGLWLSLCLRAGFDLCCEEEP